MSPSPAKSFYLSLWVFLPASHPLSLCISLTLCLCFYLSLPLSFPSSSACLYFPISDSNHFSYCLPVPFYFSIFGPVSLCNQDPFLILINSFIIVPTRQQAVKRFGLIHKNLWHFRCRVIPVIVKYLYCTLYIAIKIHVLVVSITGH